MLVPYLLKKKRIMTGQEMKEKMPHLSVKTLKANFANIIKQ